jgi:hypothetical protein
MLSWLTFRLPFVMLLDGTPIASAHTHRECVAYLQQNTTLMASGTVRVVDRVTFLQEKAASR